jgi:hypothetical protein
MAILRLWVPESSLILMLLRVQVLQRRPEPSKIRIILLDNRLRQQTTPTAPGHLVHYDWNGKTWSQHLILFLAASCPELGSGAAFAWLLFRAGVNAEGG